MDDDARLAAGPMDTDLTDLVPSDPPILSAAARYPRRDRGVRMLERVIPVPENRSIM
ncbi:hypothetical protein GCM10022233_17020 [Streptomyces shaanxiensis]|uniref:Uncharacterized protein n=1 Tax=Streptomyces shaanxiensis TaxID=653357 RepID=A0ABP7UMI6_9ACTN